MFQRARVDASGDQAGHVGHVDEQVGTDLVGDGAEARPVDHLRVGREAGHDHLRLVLQRQALDFVVIDQALVVHSVLHGVEQLAGSIHLGTVGEVAAVGQAHAEDGVARQQQGEVPGLVGLRAAVRLHVGVVRTEQLLEAVNGQLLGDVHVFAAAVVALARFSLAISSTWSSWRWVSAAMALASSGS
ncbi:hypothetical protein G6F57_019892 [Rhizopus arrhizus]|nr:hypothetical protein G6F57_019892 [Rhizopus arrhizus]